MPGHPHLLPNHFQHAVRIVTEMRRLSMVDEHYLKPLNLERAAATIAGSKVIPGKSRAAPKIK